MVGLAIIARLTRKIMRNPSFISFLAFVNTCKGKIFKIIDKQSGQLVRQNQTSVPTSMVGLLSYWERVSQYVHGFEVILLNNNYCISFFLITVMVNVILWPSRQTWPLDCLNVFYIFGHLNTQGLGSVAIGM
jgi:hypothetical protein